MCSQSMLLVVAQCQKRTVTTQQCEAVVRNDELSVHWQGSRIIAAVEPDNGVLTRGSAGRPLAMLNNR